MKKIIITILIFTVLNAYSQKHLNTISFFPDITINKTFKLLNSKSVQESIGDQKGKLIQDEQPSRIQFTNADNKQYLILYHLAGGNANTFNKFEVGILKEKNNLYHPLKFKSFESESLIRIGIGLKELIKIKGKNYNKTTRDGFVIIEYKIKSEKNNFLKKYNMPLYCAEYFFKEDKLEKFIFGFPNL